MRLFWSEPEPNPKTDAEPISEYIDKLQDYKPFNKANRGAIWLELSGKCANFGGGHAKLLIDISGDSVYLQEGDDIPSQFRGIIIHLVLCKAPNDESLCSTKILIEVFDEKHRYHMKSSSRIIRIFSRTLGKKNLETLDANLEDHPVRWAKALVSAALDQFDSMVDEQRNTPESKLSCAYWIPEDDEVHETANDAHVKEETLPQDSPTDADANVGLTDLNLIPGDIDDTDFYEQHLPLEAFPEDAMHSTTHSQGDTCTRRRG